MRTYLYFCYVLLFYTSLTQAGSCLGILDSLVAKNNTPASGQFSTQRSHEIETPRQNNRDVDVLRGQVFTQIPICGTSLYATVKLKEQIPRGPSPHRSSIAQLADRLTQFAKTLRGGEVVTRVDSWPIFDNPIKFELKHGPDPNSEPHYLDKPFLEHFAQFLSSDISLGGVSFDYSFAGNVTTSHGSIVFQFDVIVLDPSQVLPEKANNVSFGRKDLRAIFDARDQIIDHTRPEDILLFLGNTGA